VPAVPTIRNTVFALGGDQQLGAGWRVTTEFVRIRQLDTEVGSDTRGGYLAVMRTFGRLTPYVSLGRISASSASLDWYRRLTETQLPPLVPGAGLINAAQRAAGESIYAIDQRSLALGASWSIGSSHKLKLEWMRTRIGQVSRLVDTPPGSATPRDTNIDVLSVNYSFSF
jgi:hypothetical protein